jgi:hypothetical protein
MSHHHGGSSLARSTAHTSIEASPARTTRHSGAWAGVPSAAHRADTLRAILVDVAARSAAPNLWSAASYACGYRLSQGRRYACLSLRNGDRQGEGKGRRGTGRRGNADTITYLPQSRVVGLVPPLAIINTIITTDTPPQPLTNHTCFYFKQSSFPPISPDHSSARGAAVLPPRVRAARAGARPGSSRATYARPPLLLLCRSSCKSAKASALAAAVAGSRRRRASPSTGSRRAHATRPPPQRSPSHASRCAARCSDAGGHATGHATGHAARAPRRTGAHLRSRSSSTCGAGAAALAPAQPWHLQSRSSSRAAAASSERSTPAAGTARQEPAAACEQQQCNVNLPPFSPS